MSTVVSFPRLGISLTVNRVAFSIGNFDVYWYGILLGLALITGMLYLMKNSREFGIDSDRLVDVILVGTIFGVIGSRLYYVIFSAPGEFKTIGDVLNLRNGGVAFYGAVIGGIGSAIIYCMRKKIKILPVVDMAAIGFLIGQGIGRWGNFVNQEAFGTNTNLPWGMTSDTVVNYLTSHLASLAEKGITVDPTMPVHPTFLYESLCCILGFILINSYVKHRKFDGEVALVYFAWNGATRALIEGLRTDSLYIGNVRVSQLLGAVCSIISVIAILIIRKKIKDSGNQNYLIPYGHTEACRYELECLDKMRAAKKENSNSSNCVDDKTVEKNEKIGGECSTDKQQREFQKDEFDDEKTNNNDN